MRSFNMSPRKAMCIAAAGVIISGFALGVALAGGGSQQYYVEAYNQNNLIRFHVIANSDSIDDQALKRRVRDMVVEYMTPKFALGKDVEDARKIAVDNLNVMEQIAKNEVERWDKDYSARAVIGRFSFPEKTYGNITLPEGEYESVRIILGKGAGANWWCVLFPPLCFINGSDEMPVESLASEKSAQGQEKGKNSAAYISTKDVEIQVKFKLVELLKEKF